MDPIRDAVKRSIETLLNEWVEISMYLSDTPQRRRLNEQMLILEEKLLHWDGAPQ